MNTSKTITEQLADKISAIISPVGAKAEQAAVRPKAKSTLPLAAEYRMRIKLLQAENAKETGEKAKAAIQRLLNK